MIYPRAIAFFSFCWTCSFSNDLFPFVFHCENISYRIWKIKTLLCFWWPNLAFAEKSSWKLSLKKLLLFSTELNTQTKWRMALAWLCRLLNVFWACRAASEMSQSVDCGKDTVSVYRWVLEPVPCGPVPLPTGLASIHPVCTTAHTTRYTHVPPHRAPFTRHSFQSLTHSLSDVDCGESNKSAGDTFCGKTMNTSIP